MNTMKRVACICAGVLVCSPLITGVQTVNHAMTAYADDSSGTIGENLTWTLTDSGELTISGTGEWQDGEMIPEEILRSTDVVIIQDGVTSIGKNAFGNSIDGYYISSVSIPDTVTSIGERAFEGCTLGTLTIPASVRTIGDIAFCGCRNLTNVTLPASVESIGKYAFCGCENLKYFTILNPECDIFDNEVTVSNEDEYCPCEDLRYRGIIRGYENSTAQAYAEKYGYTFKALDASEQSGTISGNVTWSLSDDGVLTISGSGMLQGEIPDSVKEKTKSVIIESGITEIGIAINFFPNLESVKIPDTVTKISRDAFFKCASLREIEIPESVTEFTAASFEGTAWLEEKRKENPLVVVNHILIDGSTASGDIVIPDDAVKINSDALAGNDKLTAVSIPNGVTSIDADTFRRCTKLTSVSIPETMKQIDSHAFIDCQNLKDIQVAENNENYCVKDGVLFTKDQTELVVYPNGLKEAAYTVPDGVEKIDDYAFNKSDCLKAITLPDSVTTIGEKAFNYCESLTEFDMPISVTSVGSEAFNLCVNLKSVTLSDNLTKIEHGTFGHCAELDQITIPKSVTSIGHGAFWLCEKLKEVTILNPECEIEDTAEMFGWAAEDAPSADVVIRGYADSTTQKYAEKYGYTFKEIGGDITWNLSDDGVLTVSGSGVLADIFPDDVKEKTKSVVIESGVTAIRNAIYCFTNLESLKIPDTVTELDNAFFGCESLREIEIPESVTEIKGNAFYGTAWLEEKQKENPLVIVNHILIDGSTASGDIVIPEGTVGINDSAFFYNDGKMTSVSIPASVKRIGDSAFSGCSGLTSVEIPEGVESIGDSVFWDCENLTSVSLPASLTSIGEGVFWCDKNLTDLSMPEENPNYCVEDGVLFTKDKTELICYPSAKTAGTYSVPESVTCICTTAFSDNQNLTDITLPSGLKSIDNCAFFKCAKLESIVIPESVDSIGNGVFQMCSNLKTVTLPNSLTDIPGGMFSGSGLTEITLPEALESIGANAFSDCDALKEIRIPETVTNINREAFIGCDGLTAFIVSEDNGTYASLDGVLYSIYQTELITYPSGKTDKEFTVPDSVATIDFMAFRLNPYLEKVMIPESVTVLESDAFYMCDSLKEVTIMNPDCTIKNRLNTNYPSELCVRGYADSTAQKYAEKYGYTFKAINEKAAPAPDLDGDGKISATDAQMILNAFSAIMNDDEPDLTPEQLKAADVDGDGKVSALDAQYVLSYFLTTVVLDEPITWEEIIG